MFPPPVWGQAGDEGGKGSELGARGMLYYVLGSPPPHSLIHIAAKGFRRYPPRAQNFGAKTANQPLG